MSSRRNKLLKRLMANTTGETEEKLMKLTIERICADMCEHYAKFYTFEGPWSDGLQASGRRKR